MKKFMDKDFLLSTETAQKLYHEYAATQPIIDYHCHLSAQEICENKPAYDLTELWLLGDHYKWARYPRKRCGGAPRDRRCGKL